MKIRDIFNDKTIVGSPKVHFCKLVLVLMIVWLLLSGRLEAKFLIYGIATAIVGSVICMPLMILNGVGGEKKYFIFNFNMFKMLRYLVWLSWQLILANIEVAKAVMRPDFKIDPEIVRFKVNFDNPMALTVLANSITLTPGTVTMNVTDEGIYEIHALTNGSAEGLVAGDMQVQVAKLFNEDENFEILARIPDIEAAKEAEIASTSKASGSIAGAYNKKKDRDRRDRNRNAALHDDNDDDEIEETEEREEAHA